MRKGFGIAPSIFVAMTAAGLSLTPVVTTAVYAQSDNASVTRRPNRGLEARIQTDRTEYSTNRATAITMTLTNNEERGIRLVPGVAYQYNFRVRDVRSGRTVFQLSRNRRQLSREPFVLEGNETRTYRELWDFTDNNGNKLPTGIYEIEAQIYPQDTVTTQVYLGRSGKWGSNPHLPGREGGVIVIPGEPLPPSEVPGKPGRRLRANLTVDKQRVGVGETVTLTYVVRNTSNELLTLNFNSGKQFDATASGPGNSVLWQLSRGMFYSQALTRLALAPGEEKTYTARWTVGPELTAGRYTLYGFLCPSDANGAAVVPATATVWIGNAGSGTIQPGGLMLPGNVLRLEGQTQVNLNILQGPTASQWVGHSVKVVGKYNGLKGGIGTPPVSRNDWVLQADGTTIYVTGRTPIVAEGQGVVVNGIVRRANDGRLYLEAN